MLHYFLLIWRNERVIFFNGGWNIVVPNSIDGCMHEVRNIMNPQLL